MTLLYIYILCVSACVDSLSAVPHITVSASLGSTVVLPCKLMHAFMQIQHIQWRTNDKVVFERSSDGLHEGPGYEGRVDVPEDELHKGNCSLVLRNVKVTDDNDYRTFVVVKAKTTNWEEINKVELSVEVLQNMSAPVGSTVVLPCDYRDLSLQTLYVEWYINHDVVFKRQGNMSHQGKGYEGRVDVPEDELLKGNCSLVLKNVGVTDAAVYKSSMVVKDTRKPVLVQKVQLSVYKETEKTSDKNSASPDTAKNINLTCPDSGIKNHHYWLFLFILLITLLFGLVIWALITYRFEVARLLFSFI